MRKTGLVLEGGGTRGVFTAGVLDYFMEQDFYVPYVIGISAGACNALNYLAHQRGRMKKCMIDSLETERYISLKKLFKKKMLFDLDLLFDVFPNDTIPFDYDAFFASKQHCVIGVTNCITGKPEYLTENEPVRLMDACRASSSLPFISPIVMIDENPMLDGGLSDPIPLVKSLRDGNKKNILILTRPKGYRKKVPKKISVMNRTLYRKYPKLTKAMDSRSSVYNRTMKFVESLEDKGRVFVIQPEVPVIDRMEQNAEVLEAFYNHGYEMAKKNFKKLQLFV